MQALFALGGCLVLVSAIFAALGFRGREQVVGIDLGTTYSVVALRSKDVVTVLPDRFTGGALVPSVVSYANGQVTVADAAAALRAEHPTHTIFNAKRFIGRTMGEVTMDAERHPFHVAPNATAVAEGVDPNEAGAGFQVSWRDGERWVSPIEVGAEVVRHLKQSVADHVGYTISRAVICVPAKFSQREIEATALAFEAAGIKVMRVLEEPTAAAVAYNLHKSGGTRHVLVYDIGGGTLDTSLLYMSGESVSVLGVAGDDHLGGSDFDFRMLQLLEGKLAGATEEAHDGEQRLPECTLNGLRVPSEDAKIALSGALSTQVRCSTGGSRAKVLHVTRAEFENASADLFSRALAPVQKVLADQFMTTASVNDVVLVGGASRMPQLRALLRQFFGEEKKLHTEIDPDVTIAYGAANIVD